ncbi:MAG: TlpA family protein disulfide reductase [Gemmatimonadales bacterium]
MKGPLGWIEVRVLVRVLAMLAICAAVGASATAAQVVHDELDVVGVADYAWALETLDGRSFSLAEYRGEVLVINAWATWCTPCVAELASLAALREAVAGAGVRFLFVSPEDREPVRRFVRRYGYGSLPVAVEDGRMPDAFGLSALPTTWIIDRAGRIVLRHRGAADWNRPALQDFLRYLASS